MSLGYRIQQLRKQRKMSQEELGEKLEVTRQTVSKWELEQSTPDLEYISAISDLFEVTTDYLIKGEKMSAPSLNSLECDDVKSSESDLSENENNSKSAEIRYCEKAGEYATGASAVALNMVSVNSEKYVVTLKLKINLKTVLKTLAAFAAIFLGICICVAAVSFILQPYANLIIVFGSFCLFVMGVLVFVGGLSAFAEPLMSFSKWLSNEFSSICGFGNDFVAAFKIVKANRTAFSEQYSLGKSEEVREDTNKIDSKAEIIAAAAQRKEEKARKIREQAEMKAALIAEKYRRKAENIAPRNGAKAEKLIEKGKLMEVQILEKAGKKADIVLNGRFNRGGAHIK